MTELTDEDDQQQADGVQLDVGVAEGVAEGGVDDHQKNGAADGAEGRLSPLQEVPEEATTNLDADGGEGEREAPGGGGDGAPESVSPDPG